MVFPNHPSSPFENVQVTKLIYFGSGFHQENHFCQAIYFNYILNPGDPIRINVVK